MNNFILSRRAHVYAEHYVKAYQREFSIECGALFTRPPYENFIAFSIFHIDWIGESEKLFILGDIFYLFKDISDKEFIGKMLDLRIDANFEFVDISEYSECLILNEK